MGIFLIIIFRSNIYMIIPPFKPTLKLNKVLFSNGSLCKLIPFVIIFKTVVMKLMAPNSEETPAKCKLKIAKSTEAPECDWIPDKGG